MHGIVLEDCQLHRIRLSAWKDIENMQGNDLDTPTHFLPPFSLPTHAATFSIARHVSSCGRFSRDKVPRMSPTGRSAVFEREKGEEFSCHRYMLVSVKPVPILSLPNLEPIRQV